MALPLLRTFQRGSLARRYFLLLMGVTLALVGAASVLEMAFGYREARQHIAQLQQLQADAAAREIEQYLRALEDGLKGAGRFPWGEPGWDLQARREEWHRLLVMLPALLQLQLSDTAGRERLRVSRTDPDRIESGISVPDDVPPLGALRYGPTAFAASGDPLVRLAVADARPGGSTVVATINLRFLADVVSGLRVGHQGRTYLIDASNHLIAHPQPSEVLRHPDLSAIPALQRARAADASQTRLLSAEDMVNLNGEAVIVTGVRLPGTGWQLFVEQPRREALLPALATLQRTSVLLGVAILLALFASAIFARRMAGPIVKLREATALLAIGKPLGDLPLDDPTDELNGLASDFREMADKLVASYAGLEQQVLARTQQLSQARDDLQSQAAELDGLNRRLAEQLHELAVSKDEAERASAAKTRFLAAASHDLRQPMHSISLLLGVLQSRLDSADHVALADKIQSSVATMESLFGNLLDISKLDAGAVQAHVEDIDLGWLLHRLEQTWAPQAAEKGLRLRVRGCNVAVRGDAVLLERIVANLVSNAIRYTRQGGVLVGCRRRGGHLELQVWDSGPGIEPRYREAIFEEFFRIEAPGTSQEKGLGLGLSIVQRCAHLLGYGLSVDTRVGHGTVFRLTLPLSAAAAVPRPLPRLGTSQQALEGRFIVVVDDEGTNALALVDALHACHCHVVAAASCDEVLAELQQHLRVPDLLVTDYQLGGGRDGFEVISRLRQHYDDCIPAMLVTANTDAGLQARATALQARLLHKPIGLQRLLEAMQELLAS